MNHRFRRSRAGCLAASVHDLSSRDGGDGDGVMPVAPPMVMVVVMMVMPVPPPAMMMVMMVRELRFTVGPRFGVLRFVGHERGQGIRDRIEKLGPDSLPPVRPRSIAPAPQPARR